MTGWNSGTQSREGPFFRLQNCCSQFIGIKPGTRSIGVLHCRMEHPKYPKIRTRFEDSQLTVKNEKTCHFILGLFSQNAQVSTRRNSFLSSIESGTALTALISTEASIAAFLLSCSAWRPAFAQKSDLRMLPSDPEA